MVTGRRLNAAAPRPHIFPGMAPGRRVMADPTLNISSETVCFIIVKAREHDVQTDPDSGSNATDDQMSSVLEAHSDDPTLQELRSFINALSEEEQTDLVALMWLGRGD